MKFRCGLIGIALLNLMFAGCAGNFDDLENCANILKRNGIKSLALVGVLYQGEEKDDKEDLRKSIREKVVNALTKMGGYQFKVVEREPEYFQKILKEHHFELEHYDLLDSQTTNRLGKMFGVDTISIVNIQKINAHPIYIIFLILGFLCFVYVVWLLIYIYMLWEQNVRSIGRLSGYGSFFINEYFPEYKQGFRKILFMIALVLLFLCIVGFVVSISMEWSVNINLRFIETESARILYSYDFSKILL